MTLFATLPLANIILSNGIATLSKIDETIRKMKENNPDDNVDVDALFRFSNACRERQTSKPDDVTLCLGGIMGLNIRPLLEYEGAARTRSFLSLLERIPVEFVFNHAAKMSEDGFRWAPKHFALEDPNIPDHAYGIDRDTGTLLLRGLLVELEYEWLQGMVSTLPHSNNFTVDDDILISEVYWLYPRSLIWRAFPENTRLALLYRSWQDNKAALVSVQDTVDDVIYARFEALVDIEKQQPDFLQDINFVVSHTQKARDSKVWCIG
jgi:hypothetical protein